MPGFVSFERSVAALIFAAIVGMSNDTRAQSTTDVFSLLPNEEIAGEQIGWSVNRTVDAFVNAVDTNRPLILVFGDTNSQLAQKFAEYVAPCPHLNQLAGVAVFAYGSPIVDEYARRIAVALKLTDYPTISVIAPRTDQLHELFRLEGFFDARTVADDLLQVLIRENFWPDDRALPATLPSHVLAYPNLACTPDGARRLGIVPADGPAQ